MIVKAPDWFHKAKIYHIFIDRFAGDISGKNRPEFMGGTIKGIIEHLEYIKNLGFNTIWLSPFYKGVAYHGYHITDFYSVDEHFGNIEDIKQLVSVAHSENIKVIADFIPNHCSRHHPYFEEAKNDQNSQYYNWFYFKHWPDDYLCFMYFRSLPKLNLNNKDTYQYVANAAKYWLSTGIDGFRLDHAIGPSHKFWDIFYNDIKFEYPETVLIGEVWGQGFSPKLFKTIGINHKTIRRVTGVTQESLQHEYVGVLDGVLDFKLNDIMIQGVKKGKGFSKDKHFRHQVDHHIKKYPNDYLVTFLDNHDVNRFMLHCNDDFDLVREAIDFLLSTNRPYAMYYGTEIGMTQKSYFNNESHSDLLARAPFNWKRYNKTRVEQVRKILNNY